MIHLNINELFYPLVKGTVLSYTNDKTKKFKLNKKQNETGVSLSTKEMLAERQRQLKEKQQQKLMEIVHLLIHLQKQVMEL